MIAVGADNKSGRFDVLFQQVSLAAPNFEYTFFGNILENIGGFGWCWRCLFRSFLWHKFKVVGEHLDLLPRINHVRIGDLPVLGPHVRPIVGVLDKTIGESPEGITLFDNVNFRFFLISRHGWAGQESNKRQ